MSLGILSRRFTDVELTAPITGIGGLFHVELRDARTGFIKQSFSMPNIITSAGLNEFLGGSTAVFNTLVLNAGVGTNNTAPTLSDTALGAQVGGRVVATGGVPDESGTVITSPEYVWRKQTREWGTTEGNGNLTEVGLFSAATGGLMWCRSLFKDAGGTPITVTKTSSDILRVTYETRLYPALADATQTALNISGTNYDVTWRPVSRTLWPFALWSDNLNAVPRNNSAEIGTATALLTRFGTDFGIGTVLVPNGTPTASYNSATLTVSRTHIWTPAAGALSVRSLQLGALVNSAGLRCPYHGLIATVLNKTGSNQLALNYEIAWSRVTP